MRSILSLLAVAALLAGSSGCEAPAFAGGFTLPTGFLQGSSSVTWMAYTSQTPTNNAALNWELGSIFSSSSNGHVVGIRWWKFSAAETGTHTVKLWTGGGSSITTQATTGETSSGWQTATLSSPQAITASTTYVVSVNINVNFVYSTPTPADVTNGPLTIPHNGGVTCSGCAGSFPTTNGTDGQLTFVDPIVTIP